MPIPEHYRHVFSIKLKNVVNSKVYAPISVPYCYKGNQVVWLQEIMGGDKIKVPLECLEDGSFELFPGDKLPDVLKPCKPYLPWH